MSKSTQAGDLTAREAEVIRILGALYSSSKRFAVVGGYAVNALASHRFSVDCDVVVSDREAKSLVRVLKEEGYGEESGRQFGGMRGAKSMVFAKLIGGNPVSVDLFVNAIICRQTDGRWHCELIIRNSSELKVVGATDSTPCLVPRRELLIAMKLHSGRDTDLRDIVMLDEHADWDDVVQFANTGIGKKVIVQLESAIKKVSSRDFSSALRAEFALRVDVSGLIDRTVIHLKSARESLSMKRAKQR